MHIITIFFFFLLVANNDRCRRNNHRLLKISFLIVLLMLVIQGSLHISSRSSIEKKCLTNWWSLWGFFWSFERVLLKQYAGSSFHSLLLLTYMIFHKPNKNVNIKENNINFFNKPKRNYPKTYVYLFVLSLPNSLIRQKPIKINLTKETTQTCIEQLYRPSLVSPQSSALTFFPVRRENLYSTFILDYAICEDTISLLWNELVNLNETYAVSTKFSQLSLVLSRKIKQTYSTWSPCWRILKATIWFVIMRWKKTKY